MTTSAWLRPLLNPSSVAIVGVSPKARYGMAMLQNNDAVGFKGPVYPVNPNYGELEGRKCYPSLAALPQVPDCIVLVVPAKGVLELIEEAGKIGVKAAIVVAQGFSEADTAEGQARQQRLVDLAKTYGMAIAGPNCLGIASFTYGFANTYSELLYPIAGGISILSQSGGLLNAVAAFAADRQVGLNYLISFGNQAVVTAADYIDFLADDPKTRVIACIMEGAKQGRRFRAAIERASRKKPLVVQKLGRSLSGKRATMAHTGTLAGDDAAFVTLFQQNGVALVESLDALMETAIAFDMARHLPRGNRTAMVTISGGTTGLIADIGEAAGLSFPVFTLETDKALQGALEFDRSINNPLDTTSWPLLSDDGKLDRYLDILLAEDSLDLVGLAFRIQTTPIQRKLFTALAARARTASKLLFAVSTMSYSVGPFRKAYPELSDLLMLEDMERGQRAIRRLIDYAQFRERIGKQDMVAKPASISVPSATTARASFTEYESKKLLAAAGLPVTRERLVNDASEVAQAAMEIGFPVALKIQSPDVPHKSDAGGVVLGVSSNEAAREAYDRIIRNVTAAHPEAAIDGVLVQEMVSDGIEMILGMNRGELGPLVVLGLGGLFVEVMKDVALRFPPLSAADVRAMLSEIKGSRLLDGYRGGPPADVDALVEAVVAFGDFVTRTDGRFSAIDINPIIVGAKGKGVRIADALMVPVSGAIPR